MTSKAAVFAANFAALYVAHQWADHAIQRGQDALTKQNPGPEGAKACARHVGSYTATTAAVTALVNHGLGIRVSWRAWAVGQALSAGTHYFADRGMGEGAPFRAVVRAIGNEGLVDHCGVVRADGLKDTGPGTGRYALDQAWHTLWLGVAAYVTAVFSGRR